MALCFILQALASPSQRRNLLQELFADIALEVDDRAKGESWNAFVIICLICDLVVVYAEVNGNAKSQGDKINLKRLPKDIDTNSNRLWS